MKKNLLVAQSGGPTAAINATLAGVIQAATESELVENVFGAFNGIKGILEENFINLSEVIDSQERLDMLSRTPAAALGSCRFKLNDIDEDDSQYQQIIEIFKKHNIGYFIYIGGNDSMDTVQKISEYCQQNNIQDIKVMGAPKTIDNDLCGIDHCPGFGSAAKYIATVFAELERESEVYNTKNVIVVELMGRHAGWLTAAASLAQNRNSSVPYLIYLEERIFDMERFISDVQEKLAEHNSVMVAVSEGVHDASGRYICEQAQSHVEKDVFGHTKLTGTGRILEAAIKNRIGCKVRSIELNLLQRCAAHIMSGTDIRESRNLGAMAVKYALEGVSGQMSSLVRTGSAPYTVEYTSVDIHQVANHEKKIPDEWINEAGNGVTEAMLEYLKPLIQGELTSIYKDGVPQYVVLR